MTRALGVSRVWDRQSDDTLVCVGVRQETHDVRTLVFRGEPDCTFDFLPGQFVTLELPAIGLQRCYTIASAPTRPHRLEITTKRSGPASSWLHDNLRPGARLTATGPAGDFTWGAAPRGKFLFLAAGAGITPLMSMARTAHDLHADADIVLVQSARSPADLLFEGELRAMSARPAFRATAIVEQVPPNHGWPGLRGRLSLPALAALVPDFAEREIFCCGPAPYMAAIRAILADCRFDMRRYHEESFSFAAEPLVEPLTDAPESERHEHSYAVVFSRSGRTVACPAGSSVLAAARAAGLRLPSACGKGVCGTCKSRMTGGTVDMTHGGGIRQREIDAGMVLLCCARPTADLVIDR